MLYVVCFFFSSRRRHTRCGRDWSSDVCSSDLSLEKAREGWNRAVTETFFHAARVHAPMAPAMEAMATHHSNRLVFPVPTAMSPSSSASARRAPRRSGVSVASGPLELDRDGDLLQDVPEGLRGRAVADPRVRGQDEP